MISVEQVIAHYMLTNDLVLQKRGAIRGFSEFVRVCTSVFTSESTCGQLPELSAASRAPSIRGDG